MNNLSFSQASLEDYRTCPRRYHLRYLEGQKWPALVASPPESYEIHRRQGVLLHRMIQQHILGFSVSSITSVNREEPLATWFQHYLDSPPGDLPRERIPEFECSTRLEEYHLVGKFDLLAYEPGGRFVIVDWKTNRQPPSPSQAAERMQTRIYPYLLVEAGAFLNHGTPIEPEQVEMVYWYAGNPQDIHRFPYSRESHTENQAFLLALMDEITALDAASFPLTDNQQACVYCTYRSLCGRGNVPGAFQDLMMDEDSLDLEQEDTSRDRNGLDA